MMTHHPATIAELTALIGEAAARGGKLSIRGGGSKSEIGAPVDPEYVDMGAFSGVIDYDPAELVLTVGSATPLTEIEALVAAEGQMLAFEPFDHGPLFGKPEGGATIGGVLAAGGAGPRRVTAGSARDHLLGFTAVSGRGEAFVAGAKVVKNVTGYDLPKLLCGSWGRLAAMVEVTLKVLPRPRETRTLAYSGLDPAEARALMARAMSSQAEVSGAAYLPSPSASCTAIRLEGFGPSVAARAGLIDGLLADHGPSEQVDDAPWNWASRLPELGQGRLWRVSLPSSRWVDFTAAFPAELVRYQVDWAGALVWLAYEGPAKHVRNAAAQAGGHAMFVRGTDEARAAIPALSPQPTALAALEERVRRAFDPAGVFETGRFL